MTFGFAQGRSPMPVNSADRFSLGSLDRSPTPRTPPPLSDHLNDPLMHSRPGYILQPRNDQSVDDSEERLGGPVPVRRPPDLPVQVLASYSEILDFLDIPYASRKRGRSKMPADSGEGRPRGMPSGDAMG